MLSLKIYRLRSHRGKLHQSARVRFSGLFRCFWGCVIFAYLCVISQLDLPFVFSGVCYLLIPLVSVVVQILLCSHKLLSCLLFSVTSRYLLCSSSIPALSHMRQKPVLQGAFWEAGLFDACSPVLFSNEGEATSWGLSPNCSELCLFPFAVWQISGAATTAELCFVLPRPLGFQGLLFPISTPSLMR